MPYTIHFGSFSCSSVPLQKAVHFVISCRWDIFSSCKSSANEDNTDAFRLLSIGFDDKCLRIRSDRRCIANGQKFRTKMYKRTCILEAILWVATSFPHRINSDLIEVALLAGQWKLSIAFHGIDVTWLPISRVRPSLLIVDVRPPTGIIRYRQASGVGKANRQLPSIPYDECRR